MSSVLTIRIRDLYKQYDSSLLVDIFRSLHPTKIVADENAPVHLEIVGPFKMLRPRLERIANKLFFTKLRGPYHHSRASSYKVSLYHTEENTRFDAESCDFSISSDLAVVSGTHFRMPNWWGSIDWSDFGITNVPSPRMRKLISLKALMTPIGKQNLARSKTAAIFTSHAHEPRGSIIKALSAHIELDGYGRLFNDKISDHNDSGFFKDDILHKYMFSVCPENGMYPGYYTEKVPESFAAGCIPVTWADQNIKFDFNEGSYINLAEYAAIGYGNGFINQINNKQVIDRLVSTPLLTSIPDIGALKLFLGKIIEQALG